MTRNKHSVAIKQCNSTRKHLLAGNIVPHLWYSKIKDERGNPDFLGMLILADVVACFRNNFSYNSNSNCLPELVEDCLAVSYDYFENKFFVSKERIRKAFVRLEQLNVLFRQVRNVVLEDGSRNNKLFLSIETNFFDSCFLNPELDIRLAPTQTLAPSPQIQGDHISKKNKIKKDRSMDYASYEASFGSNFLELSASNVDKNNNALALQILSEANVNLNPDNQFSSQVKKPSIDKKSRKLGDFYPLNITDCNELQKLSGRDFSLNAMNEILRDMSKKLTDPEFKTKKGFLSYMAKAFAYEMRDAVKISNENFKIKANLNLEESRAGEIENYLSEIENNRQVTPEWHLKKKLASVLESTKAYNFLKAYRSIAIEGDKAKIHLYKPIQLSQLELEQVLSQVKATHERFENGEYNPIQKIELIMPTVANRNQNSDKTNSKLEKLPNTLWGRVRSVLIGIYGEAIDISWFSKLEATENTEEKAIKLKASSEFIKDWIERNYEQAIEQAAEAMGIRIKGFEC